VANNLLGQRRAQMFPKLASAQLARSGAPGAPACRQAGADPRGTGRPTAGCFRGGGGSVEALAPPSATQAAVGLRVALPSGPGTLPARWAPCAAPCPGGAFACREAGTVLLIDTNSCDASCRTMRAQRALHARFHPAPHECHRISHSEVLLLGSDHSADNLAVTGVPDA